MTIRRRNSLISIPKRISGNRGCSHRGSRNTFPKLHCPGIRPILFKISSLCRRIAGGTLEFVALTIFVSRRTLTTAMGHQVSCFPLVTVSNFTYSSIFYEPKNQAGRIIFSINNKICRIKVPQRV